MMPVAWLSAGASACLLLLASAAAPPQPRLLWNVTASAPEGLFLVLPSPRWRIGDWIAARPPEGLREWLAGRGYLPAGVPLVKRVNAGPGQVVCRTGLDLLVDGRRLARARLRDRQGRPLPAWQGCRRLNSDDVLLLTDHPDSLDSRYFGPVSSGAVLGVLRPLVVRDAP